MPIESCLVKFFIVFYCLLFFVAIRFWSRTWQELAHDLTGVDTKGTLPGTDRLFYKCLHH